MRRRDINPTSEIGVVAKLFRICLLAAALLAAGCAGQSVAPIDIHNPIISAQSRRFVADAQDAVSIAKNGVNEADHALAEVKARRRRILSAKDWKKLPQSSVDAYKGLLDARVHLAELRVTRAKAELSLAHAKLTQVYAETAVRHDLETYDMKPIRKRVDRRLAKVRAAKQAINAYLPTIDKASRAWWKSYQALLESKKHPDVFFAIASDKRESPFHIEKPETSKKAKKGKKAKKAANAEK